MGGRRREEVLNVVLAQCISQSGMVAAPENIVTARGVREMPDVLVTFRGLRCAIEGKVGDTQAARSQVTADAAQRVEVGIAQLAVGVVYPPALRAVDFGGLSRELRGTMLDFIVCTEAGPGEWRRGYLGAILDELRRAHEQLAMDDVVTRSVERLQLGMQEIVAVLKTNIPASSRLAEILGIYEPTQAESEDDDAG